MACCKCAIFEAGMSAIQTLIFKSLHVLLVGVIVALLLQGCANIVPPEGGKKDETPPVLTQISPADSMLNTRIRKISLHFNKFVEVQDLDNNMQLSPLLSIKPTLTSFGKRVEIRIADTLLKDSTTYIISLGNAIVDNRENTPFGNFKYTFSTGSYFDSLQLQGQVFDAATGLPDSGATIVLYPEADGDSAIVRKKPLYVGRSGQLGVFTISSLPDKPFRVYALADKDNNYYFNPEEDKVGFIDQVFTPGSINDTAHMVFYLFKQPIKDSIPDNTDTTLATAPGGRIGSKRSDADKNKPAYRVNADTSNTSMRTMPINEPLEIILLRPLSMLDQNKIYLSYDENGVEVEAVTRITQDSSRILLQPEWQQDRLYTLRLVKGWAKDTAGVELLPEKYFFRTKRNDDYGIMRIRIMEEFVNGYNLLGVYSENDTVYMQPLTDSIVTIELLNPGGYTMNLIIDENHNGKWDTGNLFEKLQPERVIPFTTTTQVRAGWEHEVDFIPPKFDPFPPRAKNNNTSAEERQE